MESNGVEPQFPTSWQAFESRWRELLGIVPAATYTCDAEGRITFFNRLAQVVWGRTPKLRDPSERFCGSYRLHLPDGRPIRHEECWMALALQEGKAYRAREIVIERPDGGRTLGEAYAYPLRNERGELVGAVNLVADVTPPVSPSNGNGKSRDLPLPRDAVVAMIDVALSLSVGMPFEQA